VFLGESDTWQVKQEVNMGYEDAGFTKVTWKIRQAIKRLILHSYLSFFLRYSGFFLLGLIIYLHFLFNTINHNQTSITVWIAGYLAYLIILEFLRTRRIPFYDSNWFVIIRIFTNVALISWLLHTAPLMRSLLFFAYLIPFISSIVYFPQNQRLLWLVYECAIAGIIIGSIGLELESPLTFWQTTTIAIILGVTLIIAKLAYDKLLSVPESVSNILERMKGTLDLVDIVDQIGVGVSMITGADGLFILIVDPEYRSYITHKIAGIDLSPSFKMDELIRQCDAIQNGSSYEKDDLDSTDDKRYFQQFFTPPPRTILIEPIIGERQSVLGLIMVGSANPIQFDELKKRFFRNFVQSISAAVETSLLYRRARLNLFTRRSAAEQLLEVEEESQIMRILVEQGSLIGNMDGCVLHRYDRELGHLVAKAGVRLTEAGELVSWTVSSANSIGWENSGMQIGIAWKSMLKREIIVADDVRKHPWFVSRPHGQEFTSLMSAPIIDPTTQYPLGALSVYSKQPAAFTTEDQSILVDLANEGAISIARVQRSEDWRLRGGILKEIFESTLDIDYEASEQVVTQQLADIARRILPFRMIRIRLHDPTKQELISVAAAGYPEEDQQNLIGTRLPLAELKKFLKVDYEVEKSFLIPSGAPDWKEFAESYLYIPKANEIENATWDRYDAFFTPLHSENGELLGYIAWDQPENGTRPTKRIVEVVGAFASMASWSIDLVRAYRRITEQRGLIGSLIAATTDRLATTGDTNIMSEVAVDVGRERLRTEACSLYLIFGNELELTNSTYLNDTAYIHRRKQIKAEVGSGLSSWVAATQKPLYFNSEPDYQEHPGWAGETEQLKYLPSGQCKNLLLVPIMGHSHKCLGVISFENKLGYTSIADFSDSDIQAAINLAEELGLSLGLAEQLKNARALEQQMMEDDLHELKNQFYFGLQTASDNALYWLRQGNYKNAEKQLEIVGENSVTILEELYNLHTSVQKKYYESKDFRTALHLIVDTLLHLAAGKDISYEEKRARIKIEFARDIQLTPLLQYALIRVVSGALMNAIRHSGFLENSKVRIKIRVERDDGYVRLIVQDNGHGVEKIKPGYGIGRMWDLVRFMRSKGFDVRLAIDSEMSVGTNVILTVKLTGKES
jgi:GAF domain-containing protein/two-component sensor histidine kinase